MLLPPLVEMGCFDLAKSSASASKDPTAYIGSHSLSRIVCEVLMSRLSHDYATIASLALLRTSYRASCITRCC